MNVTILPTRKVSVAALAGTIITLIVYILNGYVSVFQARPISAELAATVITLATTLLAYFVRPAATETTITEDGVTKTART